MKKNVFLTHLETLQPAEVKKFALYLKSNYEKSKILLKIFDFYVRFYHKKKPVPALEVAYEAIFLKKAETEKDIRNLQNGISDLFLKLKTFLIQKKVMETEFEKEFLWLQILEERKLIHQRDLQLKNLSQKEAESSNSWSRINEVKLYHYSFFRNDFEKEKPNVTLIEKGIQQLDDFYCGMQLKYTSELLNRENLLSIPPTPSRLLDPILSQSRQETFSLQHQLYLQVYEFLEKKDWQKYQRLKALLFKHSDQLHSDDKLTTLIYLLNYLAEELKKGRYELRQETFELYQYGLTEDELLIHQGTIDSINFRNIVNLACHLKAYSWAEAFIQDYQKYLEDDIRIENKTIAMAMLNFERGYYAEVIKGITKNNMEGIHYIIMGRIYLLASKYELDNTSNLEIECESFIRFVKRSKKLGSQSELAASRFGKILHQLIQKKLPVAQLREEVADQQPLYFKSWLETKLTDYDPIA